MLARQLDQVTVMRLHALADLKRKPPPPPRGYRNRPTLLDDWTHHPTKAPPAPLNKEAAQGFFDPLFQAMREEMQAIAPTDSLGRRHMELQTFDPDSQARARPGDRGTPGPPPPRPPPYQPDVDEDEEMMGETPGDEARRAMRHLRRLGRRAREFFSPAEAAAARATAPAAEMDDDEGMHTADEGPPPQGVRVKRRGKARAARQRGAAAPTELTPRGLAAQQEAVEATQARAAVLAAQAAQGAQALAAQGAPEAAQLVPQLSPAQQNLLQQMAQARQLTAEQARELAQIVHQQRLTAAQAQQLAEMAQAQQMAQMQMALASTSPGVPSMPSTPTDVAVPASYTPTDIASPTTPPTQYGPMRRSPERQDPYSRLRDIKPQEQPDDDIWALMQSVQDQSPVVQRIKRNLERVEGMEEGDAKRREHEKYSGVKRALDMTFKPAKTMSDKRTRLGAKGAEKLDETVKTQIDAAKTQIIATDELRANEKARLVDFLQYAENVRAAKFGQKPRKIYDVEDFGQGTTVEELPAETEGGASSSMPPPQAPPAPPQPKALPAPRPADESADAPETKRVRATPIVEPDGTITLPAEALTPALAAHLLAQSSASSSASSAAPATPGRLAIEDAEFQPLTPAPATRAPGTPAALTLKKPKWLEIQLPSDVKENAEDKGLLYLPPGFPVSKDPTLIKAVYGMDKPLKTRSDIIQANFADRMLQSNEKLEKFVDKTFKTKTARTIAADMLDIKQKHPQVDAGYFATVYLGQVFRRKPWEEFKRLNEEEFDEGKKEVYRNFGKLMNAMGAL
jgi:hypothetical protein